MHADGDCLKAIVNLINSGYSHIDDYYSVVNAHKIISLPKLLCRVHVVCILWCVYIGISNILSQCCLVM